MRIASAADVKARFSAYLKECQRGPVVVTRNGQPAAALAPILDEDELEDLVLAYSPRFRAILGANSMQPVSMTAATRIRNGCGPLPCTYASRPPKTKNGRRHCVATTVRRLFNDSRQHISGTAGAAPPPAPAG